MAQPRRRRETTGGRIRFYYEKDAAHGIVHASGMYGGPTPTGELYIAFFSHHPPLPEEITHSVEGGRLGGEVSKSQTRQGFVRTVGAEVIMTLETARSFREWLDGKIRLITEAGQGDERQNAATSD